MIRVNHVNYKKIDYFIGINIMEEMELLHKHPNKRYVTIDPYPLLCCGICIIALLMLIGYSVLMWLNSDR